MCAFKVLDAAALFRRCDPGDIPYATTDEAPETADLVGQDRAVEAVRFGVGIAREGYNLFAMGPHGVGKHTLLRRFLDEQAAERETPSDWCYVQRFDDPHRPRALRLPPGSGRRLRDDTARAVDDLRAGLRAALDGEEHRTRKQRLINAFKERQEKAFNEAQERARERGVGVVHTEGGVMLAPVKDGAPVESAEIPPEEQARIKADMERVGEELHALFHRVHDWEREHREAMKAVDREAATAAARRVLDRLRGSYAEIPDVVAWLDELQAEVVEHAEDLLQQEAEGVEAALRRAMRGGADVDPGRRYQVNLIVDNADRQGAPVVYEAHPTHANLVGRIEHVPQFGALVTDFTHIAPGALHRANGGFLLVDALKVLQNPFAWDALKRALRFRQIRMETPGEQLGLVSTISLEPEPVALDGTKVVLVGDRSLYYLLATLDPDFLELFKVLVDFEERTDRTPGSAVVFAGLIAALARKEGLRRLDRSAVARVVEQAARLAGDAEKLTVHMRAVADLVREADYWAGSVGRDTVTADDVQKAIDAGLRRADRVRERALEAVQRRIVRIETSGEHVGQINGLSVFQLGELMFGHPTRITARVRVGKGDVVDIEREVELGGPIHSKGMLILAGFLGGRFAERTPLAMSASLVFEQSYGRVEGDSASLAETCALLSALADAPLKQSFAVTGSIDQHGRVQAIGGVNEKIEGFFDVCRARGLTGEQGVLVPESNVSHLMLRRDVVESVEAGRFRVVAVGEVDDAVELLTGRPAGTRGPDGRFPADSLNARVEARLAAFAEAARAFLEKR